MKAYSVRVLFVGFFLYFTCYGVVRSVVDCEQGGRRCHLSVMAFWFVIPCGLVGGLPTLLQNVGSHLQGHNSEHRNGHTYHCAKPNSMK